MTNSNDLEQVDALVIGGGPAGMVASIYLARFLRTVVLVDAGRSRVARVPRSHNYPGKPEGAVGSDVRDALRAQLARYPVPVVDDFAQHLAQGPGGFVLQLTSRTVRSRAVLLATGVTDIPPAMPHAKSALAAGALRYCPVCDAYEVVGRAIGVYAEGSAGVAEALYLRHFSSNITLFMARGTGRLSAREREDLVAANIRCKDAPVEDIRRDGAGVSVLQAGQHARCDTLYCALGVTVHSQLAQALGAELDESGYVIVNPHHATRVEGLYAAGDVSVGLNQIAVAMGGAATAASAMHRWLGSQWGAL